MDLASRGPTVFLIGNVPRCVSFQDLTDAISGPMSDDGKDISIEATIVPSCSVGYELTNTAIIAFVSRTPVYNEPLLGDIESMQIDTPLVDLSFDKTFYGLTQLYPTTPGGCITAGIIAVTGLGGHADHSWKGSGPLTHMWLQEFLSKALPNCRTIVYGYNTKLRHHSIHKIHDYKIDLLEQIKMTRTTQEERRRPLIFIGHSFGGIVITQALVKAEEALDCDDDPDTHTLYQATRTWMFFGTPHRGLPIEDILSMVDTNWHYERAELLRFIGQNSTELAKELKKFSYFGYGFKIYSFYEWQKTRSIVVNDGKEVRSGAYIIPVNTDPALLNLPGITESPVPVDGNHSTIVQFSSQTDRTYKTVSSYIYKTLQSLNPQKIPRATSLQNSVPNMSTRSDTTGALIEVIQRWDVESVQILLSGGTSAIGRDFTGVTVLHHAARTGDEAIVQMLVSIIEHKRGCSTVLS